MKRIPRPLGTTELNRTRPKQIKKHLVNHYLNCNYHYLGEPISLEDLAYYLQLKQNYILKEIQQSALKTLEILDPTENLELQKSLIALSLQNLISDKVQTQHQLNILKKAQGNDYKPFISSTVNQSLKINLDSTKQITDFLKQSYNNILENQEHILILDHQSQQPISKQEYQQIYGLKQLKHIMKWGVKNDQGILYDPSYIQYEELDEQGQPIQQGLNQGSGISPRSYSSGLTVHTALQLINKQAKERIGSEAGVENRASEEIAQLPEGEPVDDLLKGRQMMAHFIDSQEVESLPIVNATQQHLSTLPDLQNPLSDHQKEPKLGHINRRAKEIEIDLESDIV